MWLSQEANHKIEKKALWRILTTCFSVMHTHSFKTQKIFSWIFSFSFIISITISRQAHFYYFAMTIFKFISLRAEIMFTFYYIIYRTIHTQVALRKGIDSICKTPSLQAMLVLKGTLKWSVRDWENMTQSVFSGGSDPFAAYLLSLWFQSRAASSMKDCTPIQLD